jgi:hypothetical protein
MPRFVVFLIGTIVVLLVASQLALPPIAAHKVESRLERDGGTAHAEVHAFPALRLLFGSGDSLDVRGRGVRLDVHGEGADMGKLDGFGKVRVLITSATAGPLDVRSFSLTRSGGEDHYDLRTGAVTTPRDVAGFLGDQAGGALGGLFGDLAAGSLPGGGNTRVPLSVTARVKSNSGHPTVSGAQGSVAGIPAGPFAQLVVGAVLSDLS